MSAEIDNLEVALQELITKQTFSIDAVKRIEEMRQDLIYSKEKIKSLKKDYDSELERSRVLNNELDTANLKIQQYRKREDELVRRELNITKLELTAEFAELRRNDTRELALSMTRNIEIRENFKTPITFNSDNGLGQVVSNTTLTDDSSSKESI